MNLTKTGRLSYYEWLSSLAWSRKIGLALFMAGLAGVFAQIRIPLPWTPVPVTGQVLVVLLSGVMLGSCYGGLSMILYVALGFSGIPWFANASSGSILGPTAGYLIGFIPAAAVIGWAFRRTERFFWQAGAITAGIAIIYLLGTVHFMLFTGIGPDRALGMAVLPFIPFDLLKGLIAISISRLIATGCSRKEAKR